MYTNKHSHRDNPDDMRNVVHENGFGILTSQVDGKPWATHIPMFLTDDGLKLTGHIARANRHWKSFESNPDVLAIFSGPHTYISSSWYDHENVPTWNYIAVHATGKIRIVEEAALLELLKQITNKYEKASACPVSVEKMSDELLRKNIPAIVGFEIIIEKMEATYKLSQNRDEENQRRIIAQLEQRGDSDSLKIAQAMKVEAKFLTDF